MFLDIRFWSIAMLKMEKPPVGPMIFYSRDDL